MLEPNPLTPREKEVLLMYNYPLPCKQMPDHLLISKNTIYTIQQNIIRKLKVPTITHAAVKAIRNGWI